MIKASPQAEKLKRELVELKELLTKERKAGIDVFIAQVKFSQAIPKVQMAGATLEQRDIDAAEKALEAAHAELKEASPHYQENFKNVPGVFEQVKAHLNDAFNAAKAGKKEEARQTYEVVREHFPLLNSEQKKEVIADCQKLLQMIK